MKTRTRTRTKMLPINMLCLGFFKSTFLELSWLLGNCRIHAKLAGKKASKSIYNKKNALFRGGYLLSLVLWSLFK